MGYIQLEGIRLHARFWQPEEHTPEKPVFLLVHGLSSNARTWDLVAKYLVRAGFSAVAVDQRGHGLSSKPIDGYDFDSISTDLSQLVKSLGFARLIIVGQSWGGNVVLEAAARDPQLAKGLVFVDGGFIQLRQRGSWEQVSRDLHPPPLAGLKRADLEARIASIHPNWVPEGVEITLGNFEVLPDGTIRPWLNLDNHMKILRAMYDQDVNKLFPMVEVPVMICPADDGSEMAAKKRGWVNLACQLIRDCRLVWFDGAAHDIHVDQPETLGRHLVDFAGQIG